MGANYGNGTIVQANLGGSGVTTLVTGQNGPSALAVDSGHLYWAEGGTTNTNGTINEASLPDGSNPHALIPGQTGPVGAAVGA